jgi:cellulose synthase/poly-beta-1,6-N-acetylglucosamine synthase-like glycosyltransferase/peptidoglycan/xylan/chitin deacetylase (PgdA/CDA1 family)/spore germination protein YaaH
LATEQPRSFVFYDPSGNRWVRFRRIAQSAGLAFTLLIVVFFLVGISLPQLPVLGLPTIAPVVQLELASAITGKRLPKNVPYRMAKPAKPVRYIHSLSPVMRPKTAANAGDGKPLVWGFYVNWDPASMVSLRLHLSHLTHLVPEWLVLENAKGDIDDQTDATVVTIAKQANLPIYAMLTNYRGDWQASDVRRILRDANKRRDLIENIRSNLAEHNFAGVNVDFEQLEAKDREPLVDFMRELAATLHKTGYVVSEDVPVDDEAYDLKRLAQVVDFLLPMVYDEHFQTGSPGPVASEAFFETQLEKVAKTAPVSKLIVGFGNYGYDWIIGANGGAEVAFSDVMAAAAESKQAVQWDADSENPVLRYSMNSQQHEVWFLDAVTALNQVIAMHDAGFRGLGLWRLGGEDPGLWNVLERESWPGDNFVSSPLGLLRADQGAPRHYGQGEILRVSETPRDGNRVVNAPPTDQDYFREQYQAYPTPYVIDHTGALDEKLLCLTFDDGPDRRYTPAVLDILKERHVPATFFVIGVNAEQFPALIKREYAEGHEVGNHTYTHPNIATTSPVRTALELSTTQRIIENLLGVSTTFFRPPYNADSEPTTPQEIVPILRAQDFGYATISETIDPRDWEVGITAEAIVNEVKSEIASSISEHDRAGTHVVLLHDAGGNRDSTVSALPQIIDYYRGQGYRFATVGELIGKDRSQVMPRTDPEELRLARIEGGGLDAKARFRQVLGLLFLTAIFATLARSLLYGFLAVLQKFTTDHTRFDASCCPPVSVIIAAYNEEKVIARTVESILENEYDAIEILVVDDGSKDRTLEVLRERFADHPKISILSQPNGGKSTALNNGIRHAKYDILIAVDADTLFRAGTIQKLARHFADPKIGAVSGNARVGNRKKWITRFQSIEYIYGFNLDRRALDYLNAITVVPGAVGAWRKQLVLECGGFLHDTLAEDTDLTLAIRRLGYVIRYEQDAIAYTEAPEDTPSLVKQRFRWVFGTLQASWKHRDALFVPKYGTLGFIALPSIWIFQVLLSALSPFAEVAMVLSLVAGNWKTVLLYYLAFFALELLTGFLAYALEGLPPWDLALLFFQTIYYRQMMLYVLGKSFLFAIRGRLVGWGKLERKATVIAGT